MVDCRIRRKARRLYRVVRPKRDGGEARADSGGFEARSGQRAAGLELEFLDGNATVREIAPALSARVVAASHCPSNGHADPVAAVEAYAAAARREGANVREGSPSRLQPATYGPARNSTRLRNARDPPRVPRVLTWKPNALIGGISSSPKERVKAASRSSSLTTVSPSEVPQG